MNTPNPLVPQGSLLQSKGKSTVRIAFFTIVAIHVVFIGGLLMQGCKKSEDKPVATNDTNNLTLPPMTNDTAYTDTNVVPVPATNLVAPVPPGEYQQPVLPDVKEYVVVKNDNFSTIAKKMGVSPKAIEQANPGVNSSKLQIGQKLQIPAAGSSAPSPVAGTADTGDTTTYTVKSGDMLEKIARAHGTTWQEIMTLNNMKSTKITPGQKLKLPAPKTPRATTSPDYVTPLPKAKTNP
ncbi:MAG: LysM peptidoglycan-binding domain-containing protein [Verrucomicrobiota bacterium]